MGCGASAPDSIPADDALPLAVKDLASEAGNRTFRDRNALRPTVSLGTIFAKRPGMIEWQTASMTPAIAEDDDGRDEEALPLNDYNGSQSWPQNAEVSSCRIHECGVSVDQLQQLARLVTNKDRTLDVVRSIIKRRTAVHKCRYADLLPTKCVGPPTYFVSHMWAGNFHATVELISSHINQLAERAIEAGEPLPQVYIWMDIFAINQHHPDSVPSVTSLVRDVLKNSQGLLFCLDTRGQILTRAWCLFEVYSAATQLDAGAITMLAGTLDFASIRESYFAIDVARAEAYLETDRRAIVAAVADDCSTEEANHKIRHALLESSQREAQAGMAMLPYRPLEAARKLEKHERMLTVVGRLLEAEAVARMVLEAREASLPKDHLDTAGACNNLAFILQSLGRLNEAEPLYRRALAMKEALLGPDNPEVAAAVNNLAGVLQAQGRFKEAEPLMRMALTINEDTFGPSSAEAAYSLNSLARMMESQGKVNEAEAMYRQALEKYLLARPITATIMHNLAALLLAKGEGEEAEALLQGSLAMKEQLLGPRHTETADALHDLASLYEQLGRLDSAKKLRRRAVDESEKNLGEKHPQTAAAMSSLAQLLETQGEYEEAEKLYTRAVAICTEVLGPHPNTAAAQDTLAVFLERRGRYDEAEALYRSAWAMCETVDGPSHPRTATVISHLAYLLDLLGNNVEAEVLYRKVLQITESAEGGAHSLDTAIAINNFAKFLEDEGNLDEAESHLRRAVHMFEDLLGTSHPNSIKCRANLVQLLHRQGKSEDAEALEALSITSSHP